jgi:hypothetical protein
MRENLKMHLQYQRFLGMVTSTQNNLSTSRYYLICAMYFGRNARFKAFSKGFSGLFGLKTLEKAIDDFNFENFQDSGRLKDTKLGIWRPNFLNC